MKKRIQFNKPRRPLSRAGIARDRFPARDRLNVGLPAAFATSVSSMPGLALAQSSSSPFMTGATALQTNILAWLTPIAIILVMVLGAMAMAARMSWGWCIGAILGIAMAFGAPQIVNWVRGMFGV
jgi:type IV secretion system protein VirB2